MLNIHGIVLNRIKEIRMTNDITLEELSIRSGVSESELNRIENGITMPAHDTMLKVCYGLKMNLYEVFETDWIIGKFV